MHVHLTKTIFADIVTYNFGSVLIVKETFKNVWTVDVLAMMNNKINYICLSVLEIVSLAQ